MVGRSARVLSHPKPFQTLLKTCENAVDILWIKLARDVLRRFAPQSVSKDGTRTCVTEPTTTGEYESTPGEYDTPGGYPPAHPPGPLAPKTPHLYLLAFDAQKSYRIVSR